MLSLMALPNCYALLLLGGLLAGEQARLTVAPFAQALRYPARTREALDRARRLAPANPRLYFVPGNDAYYKPRLLGGGVATAQASYAQARAYFAAFRPATAASPAWGAPQTQAALARCRRH